MPEPVISPDELRKTAVQKQQLRIQEIAAADQRRAEERHQLQEAFIEIDKSRLTELVVCDGRCLQPQNAVKTICRCSRFLSELCTDGGRAINNSDPNWPSTLVGYAARAFKFFKTRAPAPRLSDAGGDYRFSWRHARRGCDHISLVSSL